MKKLERRLKIGVQKTGRLADSSQELLAQAGLKFEIYNKTKLFSPVTNFPLDIIFLRDEDIPRMVESGYIDLGIAGDNVISELGVDVVRLLPLGFGKCKLTIGVPKDGPVTQTSQLKGKKIATTYPNLTAKYFKQQSMNVNIIKINGSVEITPSIEAADAIADLTSTGSTMRTNDLRPIEDIFLSQAIFIANRDLIKDKAIKYLIGKITDRMYATLSAEQYKYVAMNVPANSIVEIKKVIPSLKSPTVFPLSDPNWMAVHAVIPEEVFWEILEKLKRLGAQGIIVLPIEKMIS